MPATQDFALDQVAIACEKPSVLFEDTFDQGFVRDLLFVSCVIAKDAQPAGKPA
jgi:hypothetical protein